MTEDALMMYDFEQRADSILEEQDLKRLQKEINHSTKRLQKIEKNRLLGLDEDGNPLVRGADEQVEEQLVGGGLFNNQGQRQQILNEDGMIIP
jgi:hypothetical protein